MRGDFSQLYNDDPNIVGVLHQQGSAIRDADLNEHILCTWRLMRAIVRDCLTTDVADKLKPKVEMPTQASPELKLTTRGVVYANGIRVEIPTIKIPQPHLGDLRDEGIQDLVDGNYLLYFEVDTTAAEAIQQARYSDSAIRMGRTSGLRCMLKPRLRLGKQDKWSDQGGLDDVNNRKPPQLTLSFDRPDHNRLYRFELHELLDGRATPGNDNVRPRAMFLKWTDDNSLNAFTASLDVAEDIPDPQLETPQASLPRIACVESLQVTPETAAGLQKGQWIEFLRPANSSIATRRTNSLVQIAKVAGTELTFENKNHAPGKQNKVEIELDAKEDVTDPAIEKRVLVSFVVWDDVRKLPSENDEPLTQLETEQFVLSVKDGTPLSAGVRELKHGDAWTFEVRTGDSGELDGVFHRRLYFARLIDTSALATTEAVGQPTVEEMPANPEGGASTEPDRDAPHRVAISHSVLAGTSGRTVAMRDVPLKLLDLDVESPELKRWLSSVDLSEVADLSAEDLVEKLLRSIHVEEEERTFFDADVRSLARQIEAITRQLSVPSGESALV